MFRKFRVPKSMTISEFTMHTGIKGFNQVKGSKEPNSSKECKRERMSLIYMYLHNCTFLFCLFFYVFNCQV